MLLQFVFSNYKSFKGETILDLTATKESELSFHLREIGSEKILPAAVIYGANAAGKTNIQSALAYMQGMVLSSLNYGEDSKKDRYRRPTPFLFDKESENAPSSFEVYFTVPGDEKGVTYDYGFSCDNDGIAEEWMNSKARTARKFKSVFYRNRKDVEFDGIPANNRENLRIGLSERTLLVSLGARLNVEKLKIVFMFFNSVEIADFGEPLLNFMLSQNIPPHITDDEEVKRNVVKYFSSFDESIVDLRVEVIKAEGDEDEDLVSIDAGHRMLGTETIKYIPLKVESAGTLKMFALYPFVQDVLKNGGLLFVDELNARLHPLLVRTFVQLFLNPENNPQGAQLIFTAHDSWLLSSGVFRRDELWFTEKKDGCSQLYSLAEFVDEKGKGVRNDENYEKNYLLGKYGSIPIMKPFDVFKGD